MRRYLASPDDLLAEARAVPDEDRRGLDAGSARRAGPRLVPSIVRPTRRADGRIVTPVVEASASGPRRLVPPVVEASASGPRRLPPVVEASASGPRRLPPVVEASASGPRRPMLGARLVPSVIRARKRSLR